MRTIPTILLAACSAGRALPDEAPPPAASVGFAADLALSHTDLVRGGDVTFTVTAGPPGAQVRLVASTSTGASACPRFMAPHCLDVGTPMVTLAQGTLDGQGSASFDLALPGTLAATQVELQAVAWDAGTVHVSPSTWSSITTPVHTCEGFDPSLATPAAATLLADLPQAVWDTGDDLVLDPPWGGDRVLSSEAAYGNLQTALGRTLPPVDFSTHAVAVAWDFTSSTCGLSHDGAEAWVLADGSVVVQVTTRDESRYCCTVCDALGQAFTVWQIPRATADTLMCRIPVGGCTDDGTADTGYCGP